MTTKVTNIYNLKLTPSQFGQNSIVVNCSQYDSLFRVIQFNLFNGNAVYSIPEGSVVTIRGTKKDNTGFEYECDYSNNVVTFPLQQQITIFPGKVPAELRITKEGEIIGSWNFLFLVEESPLSDETTISETQLPLLEQAIEAAGRLNEAFDDITEFTDETYPNAVQTIQNEGATQVANVTNEGTTQRGLVSSEGATQIANIQEEGATQVGNVQAKGDEVVASIPSDYTELSGDVADLKNAIDAISNRKLTYQNPLNLFPDADISELKTSATEGYAYSPTGTLVSNFYRGVNGVSLPSSGNLGFLIPVDDISDGDYVFSVKRSVSTTGRCTLQYLNQALGGYETVSLDAISGNSPVWETALDITAKKAQYSGLKYLRVLFGNTGSNASVYYMPMMIPASTKYKAFFVNTSSPLSGKKIALDGDSITYGQGFVGGYAKLLGEEFGMTVQNNAVGGGTLATGTTTSDNQNRHWVSDSIDALDEDADYVLISGGINDFFVGVPIGTLSVNKYNSTLDTTTLIGATEKVCRDLVNRFPAKKIGFMLTHSANDWYRKNYQGQASDTANLTVYHDAIITALKKYSIPYCDLFNDGQFSTEITALKQYTYNNDGIHPTEDGYRFFYCDKISRFLESL